MAHWQEVGRYPFPEYNGEGRWYRHRTSGCEIFHLYNKNPENLFAFCFVTPPPNSTGVSHILEHTVLCGSRNFPLADPFLHLLKGSVHSFLNAITFPDRTIYPAASALPKDLFNIMQVYGDAVFAPLLREQMFEQEGHRLLVDKQGALSIGGVVYNEMRGISITHEYVESEWVIRGLLSDTPYRHASGGDPIDIPSLTYEQFVSFYRQHYHPSVGRIFLYGNIPSRRYLQFLHKHFLQGVTPSEEPRLEIASQPRWKSPRSLIRSYPQGTQQSHKNQSSLSLCWLLEEAKSSFDILCVEMLSALLIDTPATPLYRAIIESHLGEDISASSGAECELQELIFVVGVRGSSGERWQQFEELVLSTLKKIVKEGIDPELMEGALVQLDISQREIRALEGLRLLRRVISGWIYRSAPQNTLSAVTAITKLRVRLTQNNRFFESLIQKWLLDNPHRLSLTVQPDPQQAAREEQEYQKELRSRRKSLKSADIEALRHKERTHSAMVAQPAGPEDVAIIPHLKVSDMPRKPRQLHYQRQSRSGVGATPTTLLRLERHTNGIIYSYLTFDIGGVAPAALQQLPILCNLLSEGGLRDMGYDLLVRAIAKVGAIDAAVRFENLIEDPQQLNCRLVLRLKALESTFPRALELLEKMLLEVDFSHSERLAQLVRERTNELRASLVPAAHSFALSSAVAPLARSGWIREQWRGIAQLSFLLETTPATLIEQLQKLYQGIVRGGIRELLYCGAAQYAAPLLEVGAQLEDKLTAQFGAPSASNRLDHPTPSVPRHSSYIIPSGGNYAALGLPATPCSTTNIAHFTAEMVLSRLLSTGVLWEEIRMKGGAYGAGASHASNEGAFCFFSYRDPHVRETYERFQKILKQAAAQPYPQREVNRTIVTLSGRECEPLTPAQEASGVLDRALSGMNNELRLAFHQALLKCRATDLQAAARRLCRALEQATLSVVGEESAIQAAQQQWPQLGEQVTRLPL